LPLAGIAHLFPIDIRMAAMVNLYFIAVMILFWFVGGLIGMSRVNRMLFAGILANILSIPATLDRFLPILPDNFFTHQFTLALWWGEAPILLLIATLAFLQIGRYGMFGNVAAALVFGLGAFAVVLAYPIGA